MANITDIANWALANVAEKRIATLQDASEPARLINLHIYQTINEILRMGKWKSARVLAVIPLVTVGPAFGWTKSYQLPNDFLRLLTLNDIDPDDIDEPLFEIQAKTLLTDEGEAKIAYIQDVTITTSLVNNLDPLLTKAIVLGIAAKLAWPLQQSRTLQENLEQRAEIALRKALAIDARDERRLPTNQMRTSNWANARFVSTNG